MKRWKNNLDEMQEQKLLKIEHNGCWLAFWGLFAALVIQMILGGEDMFRSMAGEWCVFMGFSVYMLIACLKNGIWDRKFRPTVKMNAIWSLLAGAVVGVLFFVRSYRLYHKLAGSIATGIFMLVEVFVLCMLAFAVSTFLYKKRVAKLEGGAEKEELHH